MEEKTAEVSAVTEEPACPLESLDPEDNSAGNVIVEPDPEVLLPVESEAEAEFVQPPESTEEESNIVEASVISAESNNDDDLNESNFHSEDGSCVEVATLETQVPSDEVNLSATDEIITNTSTENIEETNTNNAMKLPDSVEMAAEEPVDRPEEKTEQDPVPEIDANNAVYQLEEELKRLHGDTSEETKMDTLLGDISVASILEDKEESTINIKDNVDCNSPKSNAVMDIKTLEDDKPITKDSDLEEMLSADVIMKDPVFIKGKIC